MRGCQAERAYARADRAARRSLDGDFRARRRDARGYVAGDGADVIERRGGY